MCKLLSILILAKISIIDSIKCQWKLHMSQMLTIPPGYFTFDADANDSVRATADFDNAADINLALFKQGSQLYQASIEQARSGANPQVLEYRIRQTSKYYIHAYISMNPGAVLHLRKYNLTISINNITVASYPNVIACVRGERMQIARLQVEETHGCNFMVELGGVFNSFQKMVILYSDDGSTYPQNLPIESVIFSTYFPFNSSLFLRKRGSYYIGISHKLTSSLFSITTVALKVYFQHTSNLVYDSVFNTCQLNCANFPNAYRSQSNLLSCNCISYYAWVANQLVCLPLCGLLPYSLTDSLFQNKCKCKGGFKWSVNSCIIDCGLIQNAVKTQENTIDECMCQHGFIWNKLSKLCVLDMDRKYSQLIVFVVILCCVLVLPLAIIIFLLFAVKKLESQLYTLMPSQELSSQHKQYQKKNKMSKAPSHSLQNPLPNSDSKKMSLEEKTNKIDQTKTMLKQRQQINTNQPPPKTLKLHQNGKSNETKFVDSSFTKMIKSKMEDDSISYESDQ